MSRPRDRHPGSPPLHLNHRIVVKGKWINRLKTCVVRVLRKIETNRMCIYYVVT